MLLPTTLTADEARATLRLLTQTLKSEPGDSVVIDASALQHFDSSALAVLLECQRQAQAWDRAFSVRHPPAKLSALARLYGVDGLLLGSHPAPDAAPAAASPAG